MLLIACANVANLLLARALERRREIAIRLALGAGRGRLVRQLLTESAVLSLLGAGAGLLLAVWTTRALLAFEAPGKFGASFVPPDFSVDGRVLAFTLALASLTTLLFGLAPALQATRPDLHSSLKNRGAVGGSRRRRGPRGVLVTLQVAVSLLLLVTTGLLAKSIWKAQRIDLGFDTRNGLVVALELGETPASGRAELYRRLRERIEALPGVESAGWTSYIPATGGHAVSAITAEGSEWQRGGAQHAWVDVVEPQFLEALGLPLLRGRNFNNSDVRGGAGVAIVNESLARRAWPEADPLGKRLRIGAKGWYANAGPDAPSYEIVGVVKDVRYANPFEEPGPVVYLPFSQAPLGPMLLLVRTSGDPQALAPALRATVRSLDSTLPAPEIRTLAETTSALLSPYRMVGRIAAVAALLALLLASVGLYGVLAYAVGQRTREIAIRLALGAERLDILRMVLTQGASLVLLGVGIGAVGAFALNRVLAGLLYGVEGFDPLVLALTALVLIGVGLLASYLPSRSATRVDPMVALRHE